VESQYLVVTTGKGEIETSQGADKPSFENRIEKKSCCEPGITGAEEESYVVSGMRRIRQKLDPVKVTIYGVEPCR